MRLSKPALLLGAAIILSAFAVPAGFTASVSFSGTGYNGPFDPGGVVSADLDRDGLPDMAIAGGATISVFLATIPGTFGAEADYSVPTAPNDTLRDLLAADFNGDGALDLIVGHLHAPQLSILWNNGDGTFRNGPTLKLSLPASFDLGDFNHDGLLDIATVECIFSFPISCSMNAYLGKGNGAFTKSQSVHLAGSARHVRVADMNGDGTPDLVISRTTQVLLWWGKGDGTFSAPSYLTPTGQTDPVGSFALADFNNDGKLDAVVSTGTNLSSFMGCLSGSSWGYKNTGGNNFSLLWTTLGGCADLDSIDLNGDLNQDLIYQNGDPNAGFFAGVLGNGDGTFRYTAQSLPNQGGGPLYVRDLNLDSRDDYIVGFYLGGTLVAQQTGGFKNCPPPSSARLAAKICTPASGSSPASPVLVRAAGNSPAGVIQLQVWVDGAKKVVRWHDQLAKKFNLSSGTHRITVVATDKYLGAVKKSVSVTVP